MPMSEEFKDNKNGKAATLYAIGFGIFALELKAKPKARYIDSITQAIPTRTGFFAHIKFTIMPSMINNWC